MWYKNGSLHREDGPAVEYSDGPKYWYLYNIEFSESKYKTEISKKTNMKNGWTTDAYGTKIHYVNDQLHCDDGPAVVYEDGCRKWVKYGKFHREDGPAVEDPGGTKSWFLDGNYLTEEQWKLEIAKNTKPNMKQVDVNPTSFIELVKEDVFDASWRILSKQIPKAARKALVSFLKSKNVKKSWIKSISKMLDTEYGRAIISLALGCLFHFIPQFKESKIAQRLAKEWRVDAFATIGDSLISDAYKYFAPILSQMTEVKKLRVEEQESNAEETEEAEEQAQEVPELAVA